MAAVRRFTCYDCNHTFEVPYGTGGSGRSMECPECGGNNIHRAEGDRGFERGAGRGGSFAAGAVPAEGTVPAAPGAGFGAGRGPSSLGRGRGGAGRGPRWA